MKKICLLILISVHDFRNMALILVLLENQSLRRQRVFRDRIQPLDFLHDEELISRYRLPRHCITELCETMTSDLQRPSMRSHALPVSTQVLVALRYYATGSMQRVAGDLHGISQPSVSRCVSAVSASLTRLASTYIKFPTDEATQRHVMNEFYKTAAFPNVLGCVDGTQIAILAPSSNEQVYVCRKGFHSLNVQAICDAKLRFMNIVAKYPGSAHDAFIWRNCAVHHHLQQHTTSGVQKWLLGDSGYPLSQFLMTPVTHPSTVAENNYNKKHSQTRNAIERAFGVLKMRFRCLHNTGGCLQSPPSSCTKIITACAVLHNICIENSVPEPEIDITQREVVADSSIQPECDDIHSCGTQTRRRLIDRFRAGRTDAS